jgi:hypothetical protein
LALVVYEGDHLKFKEMEGKYTTCKKRYYRFVTMAYDTVIMGTWTLSIDRHSIKIEYTTCKGSGERGSLVVKALCYKPEGRGFEILMAALGPGVYSASNSNEYQKHKNNVS